MSRNESVPPEGCGARYKRFAVVTGEKATSAELLGDYVAALAKTEWRTAECSEPSARCFRNDDFFIAVATPESASSPMFPTPVGTGPQLIVVVEPS